VNLPRRNARDSSGSRMINERDREAAKQARGETIDEMKSRASIDFKAEKARFNKDWTGRDGPKKIIVVLLNCEARGLKKKKNEKSEFQPELPGTGGQVTGNIAG